LIHFIVGRKVAAARGIHAFAYRGSFFVRQPINAGPTRLDFARSLSEFFLVLFGPRLCTLKDLFHLRAHRNSIAHGTSAAILRCTASLLAGLERLVPACLKR